VDAANGAAMPDKVWSDEVLSWTDNTELNLTHVHALSWNWTELGQVIPGPLAEL
jgi:hypothetical protein